MKIDPKLMAAAGLLAMLAMVPCGCAGSVGSPDFESGASDDRQYRGRQDRGRNPGTYEVGDGADAGSRDPWSTSDASSGVGGNDPGPASKSWNYKLNYTQVLLTPDGGTLLAAVAKPGPDLGFDDPGLALVAHDLKMGITRRVDGAQDVMRLNYSPDGTLLFALLEPGSVAVAIDMNTWKQTHKWKLPGRYGVVDVTPDSKFLVFSNIPVSNLAKAAYQGECMTGWAVADPCRVAFVHIASGSVWNITLDAGLRDLDFLPGGDEVLLTSSLWLDGEPKTSLRFYSPKQAAKGTANGAMDLIEVPNCADELVIEPGGKRALLSPNTCIEPPKPQTPPDELQYDPISVIDLEKRKFIKNLPGFGPVAVASDGSRALGFTRRASMIADWDYHAQKTDIGLIVVDLDDLSWKVIEYGEAEPAYSLSPDGAHAFLHNNEGKVGPGIPKGLVRMDLKTLTALPISGGANSIDRFLWTADGKRLYLTSQGKLFQLDAGSLTAKSIWLPESMGNLAMRAKADTLVMGATDQPAFVAFHDKTASTFERLEFAVTATGVATGKAKFTGFDEVSLYNLSTTAMSCPKSACHLPALEGMALYRKDGVEGPWHLAGVVRPGSAAYMPAQECTVAGAQYDGSALEGPAAKQPGKATWLSVGVGAVKMQFAACSEEGAGLTTCDGNGELLKLLPGDRLNAILAPAEATGCDPDGTDNLNQLSVTVGWSATSSGSPLGFGKLTAEGLVLSDKTDGK